MHSPKTVSSLDLSKLSQNEIDLAVIFIEQAILSLVRMVSKQQAAQLFEQARNTTITSEDTFTITYQVKTIGNDLIAAIGAAKNMMEDASNYRNKFAISDMAGKKMKSNSENKIVAFEPEAVKTYLDQCIQFWRKVDYPFARSYINAFQSVRLSLFGKELDMGENKDAD